MTEWITPAITFGGSIIAGLLVGYAFRKTLKIIAFIVGSFLFALIVLQGVGWSTFDYDKMFNDVYAFSNNTNLYPQFNQFINQFTLPVIAVLSIGSIVGFVKTK